MKKIPSQRISGLTKPLRAKRGSFVTDPVTRVLDNTHSVIVLYEHRSFRRISMCERKILSPGTRVQVTFHEGKTATGTVVNQYDSEPYDDTEVRFDHVYSWSEEVLVRRFWFFPNWFFPKRESVLRRLGEQEYLHSSDLHPI